jgi:16S rRNA (adenine1518-N6/adenine1519-N6)-dimethyltransferase
MITAKKSLGQHFLHDANITRKIVNYCGDISTFNIIEIGPGPGALTRAILEAKPLSYTGIEKDERCITTLQKLYALHPVPSTLHHSDALRFSIPDHTPAPRAIIANLPYNVGTEMLIRWLKEISRHSSSGGGSVSDGGEAPSSTYKFLTLMFQKEVVDRIVASPSTKDYGRLSVLTQWLCEEEALFDLPPTAFHPPPKVTSTVVRLIPRSTPKPCNLAALEKVTAAAFGQRRKMLRASLKPLGGESLLEKAGINPTLRAENLSVAEFLNLANLVAGKEDNH